MDVGGTPARVDGLSGDSLKSTGKELMILSDFWYIYVSIGRNENRLMRWCWLIDEHSKISTYRYFYVQNNVLVIEKGRENFE